MPKLGMEPTRRAEVIIPDDRSGNCKHHDSRGYARCYTEVYLTASP